MSGELEIRTVADLERILDENPQIRESIRRKLLTDEERALPRVVEQLAEEVRRLTQTVADGFAQAAEERAAIRQDLAEVRQTVQRLEEGQRALGERQTSLEEGQRALGERQTSLEEGQRALEEGQRAIVERQTTLEESQRAVVEGQKQMGGLLLEQTAARRLLPRITQQLQLSRPRVIKSLDMTMPEELENAIYEAVDRGDIARTDADAVMVADFIMRGTAGDERAYTYVVAEISSTLNRRDITRARERAASLEAATGQRTVPVAAATVIAEPQRAQADTEKVALFLLDHQW